MTNLPSFVETILEEIRTLYLADQTPWIVGFSGGKDSASVCQLIWRALATLRPDQRLKPVHIISTDTLVENPMICAWVDLQHAALAKAAADQKMPFVVHRLSPKAEESFWVMLIGKGYAAPRPKFRWCTERLKINPSNAFIKSIVHSSGEAILCLGTRKAESSVRSASMERAEKGRVRDRLSPNLKLPGTLVYSPIESWANDDVWMYLMQYECPWGVSNKDLMALYRSASADNECPIVVESNTPSCGGSRFGCWTCTMVDQDKSLLAMTENDPEKEWMLPLVAMRNRLDVANDRHLREFTRMSGIVQLHKGRPIHGPYTEEVRQNWLVDLLTTEAHVRRMAPAEFGKIRLISDEELELIQKIWVSEKYELADMLPAIFEQHRGELYRPGRISPISLAALESLRAACSDSFTYKFVRSIWGARLFDGDLGKVHRRFLYRTADEATAAITDQADLFIGKPDSQWGFVTKKALVAASACSVADSPWVALAVVDRCMGRREASRQDCYIRTYYEN